MTHHLSAKDAYRYMYGRIPTVVAGCKIRGSSVQAEAKDAIRL